MAIATQRQLAKSPSRRLQQQQVRGGWGKFEGLLVGTFLAFEPKKPLTTRDKILKNEMGEIEKVGREVGWATSTQKIKKSPKRR